MALTDSSLPGTVSFQIGQGRPQLVSETQIRDFEESDGPKVGGHTDIVNDRYAGRIQPVDATSGH